MLKFENLDEALVVCIRPRIMERRIARNRQKHQQKGAPSDLPFNISPKMYKAVEKYQWVILGVAVVLLVLVYMQFHPQVMRIYRHFAGHNVSLDTKPSLPYLTFVGDECGDGKSTIRLFHNESTMARIRLSVFVSWRLRRRRVYEFIPLKPQFLMVNM